MTKRNNAAVCAVLFLASVAMRAQPAPSAVSALFLSDIHFDPYADPSKVAKLNASPASEWSAILAAPPSANQPQNSAALQNACPTRGTDTSSVLWQSSLAAIHADAAQARFVTVSGDLLAHAFDCKYRNLLPSATHADYIAFTQKTIDYIFLNLRTALPNVPIYLAMGNNDSACTDYTLNPTHDEFFARIAPIVAEGLPAGISKTERETALADFALGGYYSAPLPDLPHTRILVLNDLFLSGKYLTCSGKPDPTPAAAQLAWLESQLAAARQDHQHVWVMGHIPPGVDLYSTVRKHVSICAGGKPQMFLASESLAEILAKNADIIRLALFGHTHSDEMRLLVSSSTEGISATAGVPLKIVASISPVNGNHPTFTLASIDPATATLIDYTVIEASNLTGLDAAWKPEYTYSTAYRQPAFDATALTSLIAGFQSDPAAKASASQSYLRNYFPGDISAAIKFAWPQYACSMNHDSARSFSACACAALAK